MIPRYSRPEMSAIWEPENRFHIWMEIEAYASEAQEQLGVVPVGTAQVIWDKGTFDIARIDEIEREVKHDVIAFLTNLAESVGEPSRFVHQGMTSSDVVDTAFSVQLTQAADLLLAGVDRVRAALKNRALEHKHTVTIGRSHGVHAEPTTFGLKLLGHYTAFDRAYTRLQNAKAEIAICKLSGAVGNYASIDPFVESYVADKLGLQPELLATQVIPRDRHAMFFATLGVIAGSIENLAVEIRHLQRSELREAEEYFEVGQKGSSAMPHKRNPIGSENLTGLSRVIRAAITPALENITLWHERDISHSSVERVFGPDATITLDFALHRLAGLIEKLLIYPDTMRHNMNRYEGLYASQKILLALTQAGVTREDAYRMVQRCAMPVWLAGKNYRDLLNADPDISKLLTATQLDELLSVAPYIQHVDKIFERILK